MPNQAFASQVSQVLNLPTSTHRTQRRRDQHAERSYTGIVWSSYGSLGRYDVELPSESQAYQLQESISVTLGDAYYIIDHRQFADRIASIYQSHRDGTQASDLEFIRFLLVLALGSLIIPHTNDNMHPPGIDYFLRAKSVLPDIASLRQEPVIAIEVLCLLSFYLQCCDQRDDAYIYVSP